jgi:hypothetical protein
MPCLQLAAPGPAARSRMRDGPHACSACRAASASTPPATSCCPDPGWWTSWTRCWTACAGALLPVQALLHLLAFVQEEGWLQYVHSPTAGHDVGMRTRFEHK